MASKLRRTYLTLLIPAIAGFMLLFAARAFDCVGSAPVADPKYLAPLVFVLSVVFAIALPLFLRTRFIQKVRHQKNVSEADLLRFERIFLCVALVTPYLTLIGYLLALPRFHLAGSVLMALYAVYYYYPSEKRIRFESRVFRVK